MKASSSDGGVIATRFFAGTHFRALWKEALVSSRFDPFINHVIAFSNRKGLYHRVDHRDDCEEWEEGCNKCSW